MATFNSERLLEGYKKAIKAAEEFLAISKKTNDEIAETAKTINNFSKGLDKSSADGLKEFNKELAKTNKLVKIKSNNDKQALQIERELIKNTQLLRAQEIKEAKERDRQIALKKREAKETERLSKAKEKEAEKTKELNTAYGKLRTATNKAQLEFKQLAAQFGINSKEAETARKKFEKLDKELREINKTAKDGRRDVGRYAEGFAEASKQSGSFGISLKSLLATGSIVGILGKIADGAFKVRGASVATKSAVAGLNATLKVFSSSVGLAIPFAIKAFRSLGSEVGSFFTSASLWAKELKKDLLEMANKAFLGLFSSDLAKVNKEIADLTKTQKENNEQIKEGRQAWSDLFAVFGNMGGRISETSEALVKLYTEQDKSIDRTAKLSKEIAKYTALEQEALAREGENAESLQKRVEATEDAVKWNKLRTQSEVELAQEQLKLIKLALEVEKAAQEEGEEFKMTAEQTELLTQATNNLTAAQGEQAASALDNRAKLTQLALDIFEQEADFILDGYENQKAINERRLEDDNLRLSEKKKILQEEKEAQEQQLKDLNEVFNKELKDLGFEGTDFDLIKEQVDLQKLINTLREEGAKALLKEIQLLGGSEIANKQIFDRVREINTQQQDQIDNLETIKQKTEEIEALQADIAEQERILAGMTALESERVRNKKRMIELEKELQELEVEGIEEKTKKQLELEKELNDLKIKEQEDYQERSKKLAEEATEAIISLFNKSHDNRTKALERELEQSLRNQDVIREGIENGSKLGEQSLALEKKLQAEREAELKRLENQALKLNALISLLQVWGETGDLGQTLAGFASIKTAANSLDGFYKGTDEVGATGTEVKYSDGKDGYLAKLDKGEMVFNSKESDELRSLGFKTRDSMLDLARMSDMSIDKGGNLVNVVNDNEIIVTQLIEQNKLLKQLPKNMPIHNRGLSDDPKYVEEVIQTSNIKEKVKRRAKGTWQR